MSKLGNKKGKVVDERTVRWLKEREMTLAQFAKALGVGYMTAWYWVHGTEPHSVYLDVIRERFPGCPLLDRARTMV